MTDQETIQEILGIKEKVYISPEEMADKLNITFFPYNEKNISESEFIFSKKLEETFFKLKVNIVPYEESLIKLPITKVIKSVFRLILNNLLYLIRSIFGLPKKGHYLNTKALFFIFNRTKIKKGISVVVTGEQESENLPMKYINSFKDNSIITILDFPKNISQESTFHEHFDTALSLFAHNMTNIVIGVDKEKWLLYNFNASHPIFDLNKDFEKNVLKALIPKIVAPIRPYKLSEFIIMKERFDISDVEYKEIINDLVDGALLFDKTSLYPSGKKINDLPFRNDFYRWIGKLHLDNRNGMSYGFLAIQLPGGVNPLIPEEKFFTQHGINEKRFYKDDSGLFIKIVLQNEAFWLKVPDVWVFSQKSGSDKTHVDPKKDIIKIGLSKGQMVLQASYTSIIDNDYKTSFDTQVILAHAVGNAIIASILNKIDPDSDFLRRYLKRGISISHWHGYIHPEYVEKGWYVHGVANPHVACSSPQSAIYALDGKMKSFFESVQNNIEYKGDIHVEPHHGTNICYTSIKELAEYLLNNKNASVLGNSYYYLYN